LAFCLECCAITFLHRVNADDGRSKIECKRKVLVVSYSFQLITRTGEMARLRSRGERVRPELAIAAVIMAEARSASSERKKSAGIAPALFVNNGQATADSLLRTWQGRVRQRSFVGEAERTVNRIGGRSHLKPLQERNDLRVIGECLFSFSQSDRHGSVRQDLDGVALLEISLA
jgi:hypothetical protein